MVEGIMVPVFVRIVVSWSRNESILFHFPPSVKTKVSPVTHGLLALILPSLGQVCHSLIVSSYCTPGSAQAQAQYPIESHNFSALTDFAIALSVLLIKFH